MPSTYSTNLRFELPANGEQANTWGTTTNTNIGSLIEQAIAGLSNISVTTGDVWLTALNGAVDQARSMFINVTGSPGVARNMYCPYGNTKIYVIINSTNQILNFGASTGAPNTFSGTSVSIAANTALFVYCDGVNVKPGVTSITGLTASRAAVTDSGGSLTVSSVTATELGYLSGVTSAIQTQLNNKAGLPPSASLLGGTGSAFTSISVSGLGFTGGVLSLPIATTTTLGGVKQGSGCTIAVDGTLNVTGGVSGVASVSVTAPLQNTGTASAVALSIPAATTSANGYITSTDWNTFNGKCNATGTNASGTGWAISITGNAATATSAISAGTCTGNAATASNATQLGGVAASGYLLKSGGTMTGELIVTQTAGQGAIVASGNNQNWIASSLGTDLTNTSFVAITVNNLSGAYRSVLSSTASGGGTYYPLTFAANNALRTELGTSGNFYPYTDNAYACGQSGNRWASVWAFTGTIQTSDETQKTAIAPTDLGLDFVLALNPVSYKWKVGGNIVTPAEGSDGLDMKEPTVTPRPGIRTHYGLLAQQVKTVLGDKDFGGYIDDAETGEKGLRYDQFIAPMVKAIQELNVKIESLSAEVKALKGA